MHEKYLRVQSAVERDCEYIIELCHTVVDAILLLIEELTRKARLSAIPV